MFPEEVPLPLVRLDLQISLQRIDLPDMHKQLRSHSVVASCLRLWSISFPQLGARFWQEPGCASE